MRTHHREPQTLGEDTQDRTVRAGEPESFSPVGGSVGRDAPALPGRRRRAPSGPGLGPHRRRGRRRPNQGARRQVTTGPNLLMAGVVSAG